MPRYLDQGGGGTGSATTTPSANMASVTTTPYTVGSTEALLLVNTSSAKTINLPAPSGYRKIKIKDVTGTAATNNITVARNGSEQIEGVAASRILQTDFGSWEFQSDGTNWFLL